MNWNMGKLSAGGWQETKNQLCEALPKMSLVPCFVGVHHKYAIVLKNLSKPHPSMRTMMKFFINSLWKIWNYIKVSV